MPSFAAPSVSRMQRPTASSVRARPTSPVSQPSPRFVLPPVSTRRRRSAAARRAVGVAAVEGASHRRPRLCAEGLRRRAGERDRRARWAWRSATRTASGRRSASSSTHIADASRASLRNVPFGRTNACRSTIQRRPLASMVAGLGPCLDACVGSSPRGDGHAAAGLPGLATVPFARLEQHKQSPR